jgi:predicted house-cleaning noncanonical NTP pyrophosphatase (MazG superfamily)
VIARLAEDQISRELDRDLRELVAHPVVVRTDIRSESGEPVLLSRRTDDCTDYGELRSFLTTTAKGFLDEGRAPKDVAFLVHRFLLGEAGAFGMARPKSDRVMIDATWGLPDGLLFHPHDSYKVDLGSRTVDRYLRCKTDYIDVNANDEWRSRPAGTPWDWKASLSKSVALQIAEQATKVAEYVGESIEVMFFILKSEAEQKVLPWFFDKAKRPLADIRAAPGFYVGEKVRIEDGDDLAALAASVSGNEAPKLTLQLRPSFELLRSREFILEVAKVAREHKLPIELEGSQLSHVYYLLDETEAPVRCVNPWVQAARRQPFGKLVRDQIPIRIERHGEYAAFYTASRHELAALIRAKMIEEATEYYWAPDKASSLEELADIHELLRAAAESLEVPFREVERVAASKRSERGGFEGGLVLVETRDVNEGPRIEDSGSPSPRSLLPAVPQGKRRRALASRRVHRLPGRRLTLPLVPPTGWELDESRAVALDAEDEVVVAYGPTGIQLQIRPRHRGPATGQIELFKEVADG